MCAVAPLTKFSLATLDRLADEARQLVRLAVGEIVHSPSDFECTLECGVVAKRSSAKGEGQRPSSYADRGKGE